MIFVLDNYDSFTCNLIHLLYQLGAEVQTARTREISVDEIMSLDPEAILLSPGPGRPSEAGIMPELVKRAVGRIPMLGVCLGHEAIGEIFGARIVHARRIMHGKTSRIRHDGQGLFFGIKQNFTAVRYHSLALERCSLPEELEITAVSEDGEIMGIRHRKYLIEGVQYHPESFLTEFGREQMANFLKAVHQKNRLAERVGDLCLVTK